MKTLTCLTILFVSISLSGCGQKVGMQSYLKNKVAHMTQPAKAPEVVRPAGDVKLAEIILRKKPHKLSVTSDPFEPLLKEKPTAAKVASEAKEANGESAIIGMQYLGMIRIMEEPSALIKTPKGKNVFKLNDKVDKLTLFEINSDFLILKSEAKTYKLKRGVL